MQHTCNAAQSVTHSAHAQTVQAAPPCTACGLLQLADEWLTAQALPASTSPLSVCAVSKIATVLSWLHALL